MNIPIDLSSELSPKTLHCVQRFADEFGVDAGSSGGICWLVELLKHIPDRSYNFPTGKFHTIEVLQQILAKTARRQVEILYGTNGRP